MRNTNRGDSAGPGEGVRRFDGPDDTRLPGSDPPSFPTGVYPGGAPAGDREAAGRLMTRATSPTPPLRCDRRI